MHALSLWRIPSIRARMTATFALAIASILLVSGIFLARQSRRTAEKRAGELLTAAVQSARMERKEEDNKNRSLLAVVHEEQGELTVGGIGLLVLDAGQNVLWRSRHAVPHWPPTPAEKRDWRFSTLDDGTQTLVFALDFHDINEELRERERSLSLLGLLIWGTSILGAWLLVGRTLSPIDRLSHQAQNASTERLKVRLSPPSHDAEIIGLVGTLNGLLARLERESHAKGRFYAAASHELRTPLQSLIGELDVILDRPRSNAEYLEALEVVRGQSLQLTTLVQDLLQLNQLEMTAEAPSSTLLNLADVVDRALLPLQKPIEDKQLIVERDLPDLEIEAPPSHLEMLVRNLVENAVKYSPAHGKVTLKLAKQGEKARLEIHNTAPIRPDADLSAWFEPFYRPDPARTAGSGGNGLGLAICRAVADCNAWQFQLLPQNDGVSAICLFGSR